MHCSSSHELDSPDNRTDAVFIFIIFSSTLSHSQVDFLPSFGRISSLVYDLINCYSVTDNIIQLIYLGCASGCVTECRTCNREVAGSNLGLGLHTKVYTQPSIPPGSVNEYQLRLGRQRQVYLIPLADEMQGVQVKL